MDSTDGVAPDPAGGTSRYESQIDQTRTNALRFADRGLQPSAVADVIIKAMMARSPRPWYLVGRDAQIAAMIARLLVDHRDALSRRRVQSVNRLQALLAELLPGQAKKDITTLQAKAMLASLRPRDVAGKTCRRLAAEELAELVAVDAKVKKSTAELKAIVLARDSRLMELRGVGPVVAARV